MEFDTKMGRKYSTGRKFAYFATALLISVILVRIFIVDSFTVEGNSMASTIVDGDYVFVNKIAYAKSDPQRNDIVVLSFRDMPGMKAIKRVVGMPREWMRIEENSVTVATERNGEAIEVRKLYDDMLREHASTSPYTYRLDPYEYFLIGDNGLGSVDSRELGPVDTYRIDGRVFAKFSLREFKLTVFE